VVGFIEMHRTVKVAINLVVARRAKSEANILPVDQLRALVRSVAKESHGVKKLRKPRKRGWK